MSYAHEGKKKKEGEIGKKNVKKKKKMHAVHLDGERWNKRGDFFFFFFGKAPKPLLGNLKEAYYCRSTFDLQEEKK